MWSTPVGLGGREEASGLTSEKFKHLGEGEVRELAKGAEPLGRHDNSGQGMVLGAKGSRVQVCSMQLRIP